MHKQTCNVPAFLSKLKLLVDDPKTDDLIYWDPSGKSFHIRDGNRLAKDVLPMLFKHNNLSSFIRQLNMYGFRKINRADAGLGFPSDSEDMEFSHQYFQRNNIGLMSRIHRRPPSYNFAASLLNSGLTNSSPITLNTVRDHVAANGGNRLVIGSEFNRLTETVRQMKIRQESTAQQMQLLRAENQVMYRQLTQMRGQLEQQGQLIQTLFSFLSALAADRRSSGIRIGTGRRKLALTGAPGTDESPACVDYNLDPLTLTDSTRIIAANPQIKRMLFSQPQSAISATKGTPAALSCVESIANPSASTSVFSQSAPILAIQDVTPRKRPHLNSVNQDTLERNSPLPLSQDALSFSPDLLDTINPEPSNDVVEEVVTTEPFESAFTPDFHLSDIEPTISPQPYDFATILSPSDQSMLGMKSESIARSDDVPRFGKKPRSRVVPKKNSSSYFGVTTQNKGISKSPMLTNINRRVTMSPMHISAYSQNDAQVDELSDDFHEEFDWTHTPDQPDGSLMNNITRSDQEKNASRQVSRDGDTNIDDVSNLTMFPSLGHTDQNEMFENLFAISPLKSIASNLPSPDPTSADDSNS